MNSTFLSSFSIHSPKKEVFQIISFLKKVREVENADSRGEIQGLKKKKRQTVTLESRLKKPTESKKSKFNYCRKVKKQRN